MAKDDNDGFRTGIFADPDKALLAFLQTLFSVAIIFALLLLLSRSKVSIDPKSVGLASLPVLLWLLYSGKITGFKAFGVELQAAIRDASAKSVDDSSAFTPFAPEDYQVLEVSGKESIKEIPNLIRRRVGVLSFEVGKQNYYDEYAISEYLKHLTGYGHLRQVLFQAHDGTFLGMAPAKALTAFTDTNIANSAEQSVGLSGSTRIKAMVESGVLGWLPGLVGPQHALQVSDSKAVAIARFAKLDAEDLPVLNAASQFAGTINRGRLNSSLLASILAAAKS